MAVEIITIRHGETVYNRDNRIQGSLDSPLTERGADESLRLGRYMKTWLGPVDAWLVSPLGRARETSRIIRQTLDRSLPDEEIDDRLKEIHCGQYEGRITDELDPNIVNRIRNEADFAYPDGECILDVMKRSGDFLKDFSKKINGASGDFRAVIVSHGNFNKCFAAVLTAIGPSFPIGALQSNTGLNRFISSNGRSKFKLSSWNDISHLY